MKEASGTINYVREYGFYYLQSRYYNPETGRFLNADIFASTGQGLLGNNMFAYCGNDPVTNFDPAGSYYASAEERITTGCGGRGGIPVSPVKRPIQNTEDDSKLNEVLDYIANEDEQVVLDAEYVAFYRGIPVVKLPIGTDAFSLGMIFLGNDVGKRSDAIETVRHEYGHAVHFSMAGPKSYIVNAFLPSVISFWFVDYKYGEYYSQPYEYIADILGQVNRINTITNQPYQYNNAIKELAGLYFLYTCLF